MSKWETIDILCSNEECYHQWDELIERVNRDAEYTCPQCGSPAKRTISAPMVLRASWHMGYRRGESYEQGKQVSKLKSERANMPRTEEARKEINREIAQRQQVVNTRRNKSEE